MLLLLWKASPRINRHLNVSHCKAFSRFDLLTSYGLLHKIEPVKFRLQSVSKVEERTGGSLGRSYFGDLFVGRLHRPWFLFFSCLVHSLP